MRVLATVPGDLEAALITGRLREAGIPSMQRSDRIPEYGIGGCTILVEDHDLARARRILAEADGGFDDAQLAELSQQAAEHARATKGPGPAPGRASKEVGWRRRWMGRLLRRGGEPENPFGR